MIPVAAGDEIAIEPVFDAVELIGHIGLGAVEIMRRDILGVVDGLAAAGLAVVHQVAGQFGLAIDHHVLSGQRLQVDAAEPAAEGQFETVMHETFAMHARADAGLIQERRHAAFEHAGANTAENVISIHGGR